MAKTVPGMSSGAGTEPGGSGTGAGTQPGKSSGLDQQAKSDPTGHIEVRSAKLLDMMQCLHVSYPAIMIRYEMRRYLLALGAG